MERTDDTRTKTMLDHAGSVFLRVLVRRMRELGLNQSALARRMHCSRAYVSKVLQGDVNFTFASACHFAQALELDFIPGLAPAPASTPTPYATSSVPLCLTALATCSASSASPRRIRASVLKSPAPTPTGGAQ